MDTQTLVGVLTAVLLVAFLLACGIWLLVTQVIRRLKKKRVKDQIVEHFREHRNGNEVCRRCYSKTAVVKCEDCKEGFFCSSCSKKIHRKYSEHEFREIEHVAGGNSVRNDAFIESLGLSPSLRDEVLGGTTPFDSENDVESPRKAKKPKNKKKKKKGKIIGTYVFSEDSDSDEEKVQDDEYMEAFSGMPTERDPLITQIDAQKVVEQDLSAAAQGNISYTNFNQILNASGWCSD